MLAVSGASLSLLQVGVFVCPVIGNNCGFCNRLLRKEKRMRRATFGSIKRRLQPLRQQAKLPNRVHNKIGTPPNRIVAIMLRNEMSMT